MNTDALIRLAANARAFAKAYVALHEALVAEGVPDEIARGEARFAATMAATDHPQQAEEDDGPSCPLCGEPKRTR